MGKMHIRADSDDEDLAGAVAEEFNAYLNAVATAYAAPFADTVRRREQEFGERMDEFMISVDSVQRRFQEAANETLDSYVEQQKLVGEGLDRTWSETKRISKLTDEMNSRIRRLQLMVWALTFVVGGFVGVVLWWGIALVGQ